MPVNGSFAPVCPVSRSQAPLGQAPVIPTLTRAADLPSVIQTVNQLVMLQQITMIQPYIPRWQEIKRNTIVMRVFNPQDQQQWVDVERITNLVFQDRSTNALFQWQY